MSYLLGILVVLVKFVSSMECPGCSVYDNLIESFNDTAVTDFGLSQSIPMITLMDCTVMCSRDIRCRSYRHNALTETCSTYGAGYSLPEKTLNNVTAEVGSRLYEMCGMSKSLASSCSTDADCDFANSACLSGSCSCSLGYSYDVLTGGCIIQCEVYGEWFAIYADSGIVGYNTAEFLGVSLQACLDACVAQASFICYVIEYQASTKKCMLCDTPWFDLNPNAREYNVPGWMLYYRHCSI